MNLVKDYINDCVSFLTDLSFFLSKKMTVSIIINCVLSESIFLFTFEHFKNLKQEIKRWIYLKNYFRTVVRWVNYRV